MPKTTKRSYNDNTNYTNKKNKSEDVMTNLSNDFSKNIIDMNHTIIYLRVSSKSQTYGTSLDSQLMNCQEYCLKNNFIVKSVSREVNSAKTIKNQVELLKIIENYANINLVVYEPTRLARNLSDFISFVNECETKNIVIHFVVDNLVSTNTLDFKNMLSKIYDGQNEIKILGQRIKRSIEYKKLKGTYHSTIVKYGYQYNKVTKCLEENETEQNIINLINILYFGSNIKKIDELLKKITGVKQEFYFVSDPSESVTKLEYGNMTFTGIAVFLNEISIMRRSKLWNAHSISQLIN